MTIRPLDASEIPAALTLDTQAFGDLFLRLTGKPVNMVPREPAYFEHWCRTDPDGAMVAEESGEIVALNMCHARGRGGWIGPLAVRPDCQSRGVGKALLAAAFDYFGRKGCHWVGLDTYPQNPVSVSLYLKSGMRILQTMFQLQLGASAWAGRLDAAAPRRVVAATRKDLDGLVSADTGASDLCRVPDFEFLLGWDKGAVFRLIEGRRCVGTACAYQKRRKGVVGALHLSALDSYAADVEALLTACIDFFKELGLERTVVLCPGHERRLSTLLHEWGASTLMTTVRLFKGDDAGMALAPDRAFIYTPFASEKG